MVSKWKTGIKYWSQIFLLPIYWFSFLTPRNKKIWLFGSTFGRRFAENPRYLYLYLNDIKNNEDNIRPIWISHKKEIVDFLRENNLEAYHVHSFKGIWYCLRGGLYLYDNYSKDISFWLSGGAKKINLWHGVGNKKINYDNKYDKVRHPQNNWERFKTYLRRMSDEKPHHYTLATSPMMAEIFAGAFGTDIGHIIQAGYPRNDALFNQPFTQRVHTKQETAAVTYIMEKSKSHKILFYMPTFRDSESQFFDVMNLEEFNGWLAKKSYLFIPKLHPKSKLKKAFEELNYSNIFNIEADVDPYTLLGYADLLVTDYSSVYSDFMLLDRPVVGFYYDYETYSSNTREGYFDFEEYMPEPKARTMEELENYIDSALVKDECLQARQLSRAKMFAQIDGESSRRIVEKIKEL